MNRLTNVRKIAVLRANGLGDFIFSVPALQALKATYPAAELVYLGNPWHKAFLTGRPGPIDRVVVIPVSEGVRMEPGKTESQDQLDEFFERARREEFDLALQIHGGGRYSNPFLLQLGARITAGLRTPDAAKLDINIPYLYYQPEVLRYLEVMQAVGAKVVQIEPAVKVTGEDIAALHRVIDEWERPLVVMHPGATDIRRRWSPQNFAAVADVLATKGATIVLSGAGDEKTVVDTVAGSMRHKPINLFGKLSYPAFTGLLSQADLVVSNDSGPLHLAGAVGTPTVGIYWIGNAFNGGPLTRSRHYPAISWQIHCPKCGMEMATPDLRFKPYRDPADKINCFLADMADPTCTHDVSFVDEISKEEITHYAMDLLERTRDEVEVTRAT